MDNLHSVRSDMPTSYVTENVVRVVCLQVPAMGAGAFACGVLIKGGALPCAAVLVQKALNSKSDDRLGLKLFKEKECLWKIILVKSPNRGMDSARAWC